jgi:uncharacterized protein YdhG (YjbR/CyaY superfamily)
MAKTSFQSVDEYIAAQPVALQRVLQRVRSILRKSLPGAEEVISYQIPTYKMGGKAILYLAAWTKHYSLYAGTGGVVAAFKDELAPYQVSKGTIRFPLSEPVPVKLIERIVKFRAKEAAERKKAKASAPKKR